MTVPSQPRDLPDRQPHEPPVRRWYGYALANLRISSGTQFDSGTTCHNRSMNLRVVIPKCTNISSSVAPPNGAHLMANSMSCSTSVSGWLRLRFASIQVARRLWRHCRYSREFMGITHLIGTEEAFGSLGDLVAGGRKGSASCARYRRFLLAPQNCGALAFGRRTGAGLWRPADVLCTRHWHG